MALIDADRIPYGQWEPGVYCGVEGGIDQYLPGGVSERTVLIDVTQSPYFAAGNTTETTGSMTSGSPTLTVASATDFAVGNRVKVCRPAIQELVVTAGASASANISFNYPDPASTLLSITVPLTAGETTTQVATKFRALTVPGWTTGGSGATVTFTQTDAFALSTVFSATDIAGQASSGATATGSETQAGLLAVSESKITNIVGTTITLEDNAAATVSGAIVSHNDYTAITEARDAVGAGEVLYFPAGTYRIDTFSVTFGAAFSGRTIRGDGPGLSIIDQRANGGFLLGSLTEYVPPDELGPVLVTAGMSKGSSTVSTTGDLSAFNVGRLMMIQVQSDLTLPVASVYDFDIFTNEAPTKQVVRIVSKTADSVTFFPPLFDDYGGGALEVRLLLAAFQANTIGIEDMTLDATNYTVNYGAVNSLQVSNCLNSWVKNVNVLKVKNYTVAIGGSLFCEIRHGRFTGKATGATNGAGLLFGSHSTLVEDNIILDAFPLIEVNGGSAGNVFAYNYSLSGAWNTNHAPHNQFNLYEGNAIDYQISDGYFGSEAKITIYRNYFREASFGTNFRRFTRQASVVGNFLPVASYGIGDQGLPFFSAGSSLGTASLIDDDPWLDWQMTATLTTRTDDNNGVITLISGHLTSPDGSSTQAIVVRWDTVESKSAAVTAVSTSGDPGSVALAGDTATLTSSGGTPFPAVSEVLAVGPGSFLGGDYLGSYQERDLDVAATSSDKGNRWLDDNSFSSLGGDTLVDSLFRSSKPSYFGDLNWPPYDPVTPVAPDVEYIPAGYRYIHGNDPPSGATTSFDGSGSTTFTGSGSVTFA